MSTGSRLATSRPNKKHRHYHASSRVTCQSICYGLVASFLSSSLNLCLSHVFVLLAKNLFRSSTTVHSLDIFYCRIYGTMSSTFCSCRMSSFVPVTHISQFDKITFHQLTSFVACNPCFLLYVQILNSAVVDLCN